MLLELAASAIHVLLNIKAYTHILQMPVDPEALPDIQHKPEGHSLIFKSHGYEIQTKTFFKHAFH